MKAKNNKKKEGHGTFIFYLDPPKIYKFVMTPAMIRNGLRTYLKKHLDNPQICSNCGALIPELAFLYEGKIYNFVCFKIQENGNTIKFPHEGKIIAKTNYRQLAKYCQRYLKPNERIYP